MTSLSCRGAQSGVAREVWISGLDTNPIHPWGQRPRRSPPVRENRKRWQELATQTDFVK